MTIDVVPHLGIHLPQKSSLPICVFTEASNEREMGLLYCPRCE